MLKRGLVALALMVGVCGVAIAQVNTGGANGIFEGGGGVVGDGSLVADRLDLDTKPMYGDYSADPDTYVVRSGANEWTIYAGGVAAMVCDASYCTFATGIKIGTSVPFADAPAGTLTLQNVDALDSTTETTIEAAIDTLANLTSIQSQTVSLSGALTVELASLLNQDLTTDAAPTFASGTLTDDLICTDDIYAPAIATDAAPAVRVIASQNPYQLPSTTPSTNRNGGDIVLAPGQGKQVVGEIVPATVAGKTITLTVTAQGAVAAGVTKTEGVAGPDGFACAGQTSAVCALNILTLLNGAGAVTGCTATCIDGTCSNGQIAIGSTVGVSERCTFTTNDSTAFPLTAGDQGVAGAVIIPRGTEANPGIRFAPSQIGFYYISDNAIGFSTGGTNKGYLGNSGINSTGFVTGGTTSYFALGNRGRVYSPADGYLQATNTSIGNGAWVNYPQTITCADSGDGNHSTCGGAQTISSNIVQLVCSDTDGCDLTLAETNFGATVSGIVTFIGPVANHTSIVRAAGAVMTSGGADVELTANDTVMFAYEPASLTWLQIAPKIENS